MKNLIVSIGVALAMLGITGISQAALITIGTAQFGGAGTKYNLISDDDNNGNSIVWLDYTNNLATWQNQVNWANGLNATGALTYNIDPGEWIVDWGTNEWRLPVAGSNPSSGFGINTSEMGHLYYDELGLSSDPTGSSHTSASDLNASNFDNLIANIYWSGTEYNLNTNNPDQAYFFHMVNGNQEIVDQIDRSLYGIAVRGGMVTRAFSVSEPSSILLFCTALFGFAASRRKRSDV